MRISLNSVKKLTQVVVDPIILAELIATRIGEVESIENLSEKYKGIIVAQIKEVASHPDADKLNVYKIDIGQEELIQVVAGDKTLAVGDKVAYIPPNTRVPHNMHPDDFDGIIRAVKLRGVESNGMMASSKELDISGNHEQVMRLNDKIGDDALPGQSFASLYGLDDYIYEVENKALVNRPECFGLIGIAREISAIQGLEYKTPDWFNYWSGHKLLEIKINSSNKYNLQVKNEAGSLCPRYMGAVIENIEIKQSPIWMQIELAKAGIRPINNVVDITNYMMLLTGQPLHAFDYDKVVNRSTKCLKNSSDCDASIVVRTAKDGETITVINGDKIKLDSSIVVITDGEDPIGIAGVMGGLDTEIDVKSKTIILESANFDMYNIRKTSNKVGISSEATTRYSRNQDPAMCEVVLHKTLEMLQSHANGNLASEICDDFQFPRSEKEVAFSINGLNKIIGKTFTKKEVISTLSNAELVVKEKLTPQKETELVVKDGYDSPLDDEEEVLVVSVPTYRQDLSIKEDIYEEIARISGFNNIPLKLPSRKVKPVKRNKVLELESRVRNGLLAMGGNEIITYSFINRDLYDQINPTLKTSSFRLTNSISPELEYMRSLLMPSVISKVPLNISNGYKKFVLFEVNKFHVKNILNNEGLPYEFRSLALVYTDLQGVGTGYYSAKKYLTELSNFLRCPKIDIVSWDSCVDLPVWLENMKDVYDHNQSGILIYKLNGQRFYLGVLGQISYKLIEKMKIPEHTAGFEINIEELMNIVDSKKTEDIPTKFPKMVQDICYIVENKMTHRELIEGIEKILSKYPIHFELEPVDIYSNDELKKKDLRQETVRIAMRGVEEQISEKLSKEIRIALEKYLPTKNADFVIE